MAIKTIKKINARLKFLQRKNDFLTPDLRRLLCNALIQPHFDYVFSSWFPNLTQKLKKKNKQHKINASGSVCNFHPELGLLFNIMKK